jgi:osmotically-inducible protein OsmY
MRIVRALLVSILIIFVAFVAFSYLSGTGSWRYAPAGRPGVVGTTGAIDVNAARERGGQVGERVGEKMAVAAEKMKEGTAEAAITSKIKAKMVLDDYVKARAIDVSTNGTTVTLSGTVRSVEEHDRAVRLARETADVTQVVDHLTIETR